MQAEKSEKARGRRDNEIKTSDAYTYLNEKSFMIYFIKIITRNTCATADEG